MGNSESSSSQFPSDIDDDLTFRRNQSRNSPKDEGSFSIALGATVVAGLAIFALKAYWNLFDSSVKSDGSSTSSSSSKGVDHSLNVGRTLNDVAKTHSLHHVKLNDEAKTHGHHHGVHKKRIPCTGIIKVMSYNVWSREDVEVHKRMEAIGQLIVQHNPDVILFQEVTPVIFEIFQSSNWWKTYKCSVSPSQPSRDYFCMLLSKLPVKAWKNFPLMGDRCKEVCGAQIKVGKGKKLLVATSHLKSPNPPNNMHSKERVSQAKQALKLLNSSTNVIFGGDMNWDENLDGRFPLRRGWVDAWSQLRSGEDGWTYDTKSNPMLTGKWPLLKRLDRFICRLQDFKLLKVDIIGKDPISGISYRNKSKILPVLPSDHYGLLLTINTMS